MSGRSTEAGLTLIEVLATSVIMLFIMVAAYNFIDASQKVAISQGEIADMDANARAALDLMTVDIREAGRDSARVVPAMRIPPNVDFVSVRSDAMMNRSIEIRSDINGNGSLLDENEYVRYEWKDPIVAGLAELVRVTDTNGDGVLDSESVLAGNVRRTLIGTTPQPVFQYLDQNSNPITSRTSVPALARAIRIQFTVQTVKRDRVSLRFREIALDEVVTLRNLRKFP